MTNKPLIDFSIITTKKLRESSKENSQVVDVIKDIFDIEVKERNMQKYKKEHNKGYR